MLAITETLLLLRLLESVVEGLKKVFATNDSEREVLTAKMLVDFGLKETASDGLSLEMLGTLAGEGMIEPIVSEAA